MTETEQIINEIRVIYKTLSGHSERAEVDAFLDYYEDSPEFLSVAIDGRMSNAAEFRMACREYYGSLHHQQVRNIREKYRVVSRDLVILSWTGDIHAVFKNGDTMDMNNYSITSVF